MTEPKEKSLPCPFCGATPHHGLTKVEYCQLHGEPFQRFRINCPHGCAQIVMPTEAMAREKWNTRHNVAAEAARIAKEARVEEGREVTLTGEHILGAFRFEPGRYRIVKLDGPAPEPTF